jgi:hypothetical protein
VAIGTKTHRTMVRLVGGKCGFVRTFCLARIVFYGSVVCGVLGDFGVGILEMEKNDDFAKITNEHL